MFDSFRTYLAIAPPGWGSGPACYLVNSSAINTTNVTFQIPPSVGPDGSAYSIATMEFNQNPNAVGPSGYEYSNTFALTNGTGAWSKAELAGQILGDADNLPCSAYNCARNCTETFYPANVNNTDAAEKTYKCTAACPGVTYEPLAELLAEECSEAPVSQASSVCAAASTATASISSTATATTTSPGTASRTGSSSSTLAAATASKSSGTGSQISAEGAVLVSSFIASIFAAFSV
jgi:hypothetical protein